VFDALRLIKWSVAGRGRKPGTRHAARNGMWTLIVIWVWLSTLFIGALAIAASRPIPAPTEDDLEFTPASYKIEQPNQMRRTETPRLAVHSSREG
jgi:hypothetical protein